MKKLFLLICLISLFQCNKNNLDELHIRKSENIDFYLNKEANSITEEVVIKTFKIWADNTHFTFNYAGRHTAGLKKDGKNTVSFLVKWPEGIPGDKIAWCQNWYDRFGNIIESDIIFNMRITRFTTLETNTIGAYYIEGVLTHEIGHMIGLGHINIDTSVMKQESNKEESFFKGNIDEDTLSAYRELYGIIE